MMRTTPALAAFRGRPCWSTARPRLYPTRIWTAAAAAPSPSPSLHVIHQRRHNGSGSPSQPPPPPSEEEKEEDDDGVGHTVDSLRKILPELSDGDLLKIRTVRECAAREGGRRAIDDLARLPETDAHVLYPMGVECLAAYRRYLEDYSVDEAREIVRGDGAGDVVWRWVRQPVIRSQIEGNHPQNRTLLERVADILHGAGQLDRLKQWALQRPSDLHRLSHISPPVLWRKVCYKVYAWRGRMAGAIAQTLVWWDPNGRTDAAYDFHSTLFNADATAKDESLTKVYISIQLDQTIRTARPPSAERFEHFVRCTYPTGLNGRHFRDGFTLASLHLFHPTKPTADLLLEWLNQVKSDKDSSARKLLTSRSSSHLQASAVRAACHRAVRLLHRQGRSKDAMTVEQILNIWTRESDFAQGRFREEKIDEMHEKTRKNLALYDRALTKGQCAPPRIRPGKGVKGVKGVKDIDN